MKGLWLDQALEFRDNLPEPVAAPGEARLAIRLSGICGTDIEMLRGYADYVGTPGHEFVATVVEGPESLLGSRVVADINIACGHCAACVNQRAHHCLNRSVLGIRNRSGAFAEFVVLPASNLYPVPDQLSDELAVLMEPLAAALEITEQVALTGDERVLIVGAGRLSQLIARVLAGVAGEVDVLVRSASRRKYFSDVDVNCVAVPGRDYDMVVECSGDPDGFELALLAVRARGTLVLKSTYARSLNVDASRIVVSEINLLGSRCGPMDKALAFAIEHREALDALSFETFAFPDFEQAFKAARRSDTYKVLLSPR